MGIVTKKEKDSYPDGKSSRLLEFHIDPVTDFPVKTESVDIVDIIAPLFENEEAEECDETTDSEPNIITGDVKKRTQSSEELANISSAPDVFGAPSRGLLQELKDVKFSNEGEMELEDDDHYFSQEEDEQLVTRRVVGSDPLLFTNNNVKVKKEII